MFKTITYLLFGGKEDTPEDVKSEEVEGGWLLVDHQEEINEVTAAGDQDAELPDTGPLNFTVHEDTVLDLEMNITISEPEPSVQSSRTTSQVIRSSLSQAEALAKVTQVSRVQRAQAWAERHFLSRSAIQRQNCARHRGHHHSSHTHSTHLCQPGHRNVSR